MGIAVIPDDWVEGYVNLCVEWPNSPEWLAILRGLLTLPNEDRFWDKLTGTISDAQAAIEPTFDNNLHAEDCMIVQTGMIMMWPLVTPPSGWLSYNGQFVWKTDYPDLWAFLGDLFGENEFEFQVGPTSGAFPVGYEEGSNFADPINGYGGEEYHVLTTSEMPEHTHIQDSHNHSQNAHNHSQNPHNHSQRFTVNTGTIAAGGGIGDSSVDVTGGTTATNIAATATNIAATATNQNEGDSQPHNNVPPFFVVNFIIKT